MKTIAARNEHTSRTVSSSADLLSRMIGFTKAGKLSASRLQPLSQREFVGR